MASEPQVPGEPGCELDCGAHGSCVESVAGFHCECDDTWAGDACDRCAEGFEPSDGACLVPDLGCQLDADPDDRDCDGVPAAEDCDDADPNSGTRTLDADCDGVHRDGDCDDADPALGAFSSDADCDGLLADADCDDANPQAGDTAKDADCDGIATELDCDDMDPASTAISQDADCDWVPTDHDCDDDEPNLGDRAGDADCDGVPTLADCDDDAATLGLRDLDADCDGVTVGVDCDDNNADLGAVTEDADCDGSPAAQDCDDENPDAAALDNDNDCDGSPRGEDCDDDDAALGPRADDADCDGVPTLADCDDMRAALGPRSEDRDCDGVLTAEDCDDSDPGLGPRSTDADCDEVLAAHDCDDENPDLGAEADDADCDGVPTLADCDDSNAELGARAWDTDCDGVRAENDCDDANPAAADTAGDADCDGVPTADDCDDLNPASTHRADDADCDWVPNSADCDDNDPDLGTVRGDADCDGVREDDDCDDLDETLGAQALDLDCDGARTAEDCDDTDETLGARASDADCDGALSADDCDDNSVALGARADDQDCDGALAADDCDDNNAGFGNRAGDADCDGALTADDCDDTTTALGARAEDADCDGARAADDCDDLTADLGAIAADGDCDGVLTADDCDDANAELGPIALDGDCDGVLNEDDCDDATGSGATREDDGDCDGVLTEDDCDDADPSVGSRANDGDCDGVPTLEDCDDSDAATGSRADDADCDGTPTALDCDDNDPASGSMQTACERAAAECGEVFVPACGASVNCGGCAGGEACITNRCEPLCEPERIAGRNDGLAAMLFRRMSDHDITGLGNTVQVQAQPNSGIDPDIDGDGRISRLDLSAKSIEVTLASAIASGEPLTVSLMVQPHHAEQTAVLFDSPALEISQTGDSVTTTLRTATGATSTVAHTGSTLHDHRCNHVALVVDGGTIQGFLNGVASAATPTAPANRLGQLTVGPFPGKVWDLRVYNAALSSEELSEIAGYCADDQAITTSPFTDLPEYTRNLCGPYICMWWPDRSTMADGSVPTDSHLRYYLKMQEYVFERHIFEAGMYPHRDLCGALPPRFEANGDPHAQTNLQLNEGIRRGFVLSYSYEEPMLHPAGNYWLHENFHAFQGKLARTLGFGGTKFVLEGTAEWGADFISPGNTSRFPSFFTRKSYVPLYATQTQIDAFGECTGGHQYGTYLFFAYLTRYLSSPRFIGDLFNNPGAGRGPLASEVMAQLLEARGIDMATAFADLTARVATWDLDHGEDYARWEATRDTNCGNIYAGDYGPDGTRGEWFDLPEALRPGNWAYNTFKVNAARGDTYDIQFEGADSNPDHVRFLSRLVHYRPSTGERSYHPLEANSDNDYRFSFSIDTEAGDELYLVIANTPDVYTGYDRYGYRVNITPQDFEPPEGPVKVFLMAGQSNMEGNNARITRLETLVCHGDALATDPDFNCGDPTVDPATLTPLFLDTVVEDFEAARNSDPDGPVVARLETFLCRAGAIMVPGENCGQYDFDFIDRIFRTVSEYYYQANNDQYGYGYDAFKQMTTAIEVGRVHAGGHLDLGLLNERFDVRVLQFQARLLGGQTLAFSERSGNLRPGFGVNDQHYGPELIFGQALGDHFVDDVVLVKVVQGGTDLRVDWKTPCSAANVGNQLTPEELSQESLYDALLQRALDIRDNDMLADYWPEYAGRPVELAGFVWFQGWNDNPALNAGEYETNLRCLTNTLRQDLNDPELLTVIAQSHIGNPSHGVQQGQATVAAVQQRTELAITDDLSGFFHFDPAAHLAIGQRMADAFLRVAEACPPGECSCQTDSCGGECCDSDQVCTDDACCTPVCDDRVCGADPACGASCGGCGAGTTCDVGGQCQPNWCAPVDMDALSCVDEAGNDCAALLDDNVTTRVSRRCDGGDDPWCVPNGVGSCTSAEGCVGDYWLRFDLGGGHNLEKIRYQADWWNKRPRHYEIWVSDSEDDIPGDGATLVATDEGNAAPWVCSTGDACDADGDGAIDPEVPPECCPGGAGDTQDTSGVGDHHAKYDFVKTRYATGRYWYFVVKDTWYPAHVILQNFKFYGCRVPLSWGEERLQDFGRHIYQTQLVDADGDNDLDIVAISQSEVRLFENQGGSFAPGQVLASGFPGRYARLEDVNNDQLRDLVVTTYGDGEIFVLLATAPLEFGDPILVDDTLSSVREIAVADLFDDGYPEIIVANWRNIAGYYNNTAAGGFEARTDFDGPVNSVFQMEIGDIDGDDDLDVVMGGQPPTLWRNEGTSMGPREVLSSPGGVFGAALVDVDIDGDLDILTIGDRPGVRLYANDAGSFGAGELITSAPSGRNVIGADIDLDGYPELVATSQSGAKVVPNQDGVFGGVADWLELGMHTAWGAASGDLDGDGDIDLVVSDGLGAGGAVVLYNPLR